jgi:hypothetical protein
MWRGHVQEKVQWMGNVAKGDRDLWACPSPAGTEKLGRGSHFIAKPNPIFSAAAEGKAT